MPPGGYPALYLAELLLSGPQRESNSQLKGASLVFSQLNYGPIGGIYSSSLARPSYVTILGSKDLRSGLLGGKRRN
jgi:hypothetical protein